MPQESGLTKRTIHGEISNLQEVVERLESQLASFPIEEPVLSDGSCKGEAPKQDLIEDAMDRLGALRRRLSRVSDRLQLGILSKLT